MEVRSGTTGRKRYDYQLSRCHHVGGQRNRTRRPGLRSSGTDAGGPAISSDRITVTPRPPNLPDGIGFCCALLFAVAAFDVLLLRMRKWLINARQALVSCRDSRIAQSDKSTISNNRTLKSFSVQTNLDNSIRANRPIG